MDCTLVINANQTDIVNRFPVYILDRDSCLPPICAQELPIGCVKTLQAKNYTGPGRANSSEACNDHVFIYSLRPCKVGKEVNFTFTVMRCTNDSRYGKARLRFENTAHRGSDPKTVSLQDHDSATNGPYGNGLVSTHLQRATKPEKVDTQGVLSNAASETLMVVMSSSTPPQAYGLTGSGHVSGPLACQ